MRANQTMLTSQAFALTSNIKGLDLDRRLRNYARQLDFELIEANVNDGNLGVCISALLNQLQKYPLHLTVNLFGKITGALDTCHSSFG